jgi:hypothetical protein
LGYYAERDLQVPSPDTPLKAQEVSELTPIVSALTIAAVESERMPDRVRLATNTPAETFVDNVGRLGFDNWAEHEGGFE